jgi:hypothetical protein
MDMERVEKCERWAGYIMVADKVRGKEKRKKRGDRHAGKVVR